MRRPVIWILVADGTRARAILAPATAGAREPMATMLELHAEHRPAREIMADAPGRAFASVGARRSAMEYHSDPVRGELERFARVIVDELEARRAAGGFERPRGLRTAAHARRDARRHAGEARRRRPARAGRGSSPSSRSSSSGRWSRSSSRSAADPSARLPRAEVPAGRGTDSRSTRRTCDDPEAAHAGQEGHAMTPEAARAKPAAFAWDDPFLLEEQLSEEERMVRDARARLRAGQPRAPHPRGQPARALRPRDHDRDGRAGAARRDGPRGLRRRRRRTMSPTG